MTEQQLSTNNLTKQDQLH